MVRLVDYSVKERDGRLEEIVYTLEDDKWGEYYRVVRLLRLLRSPRELSQVETLLEMHRDVVASFKQFTKARLVLLTTYSRRLGLIWSYGVAVWGYDLDEAREWADRIFLALKSVLKGTYRQAVFRELTVDEASEILRIMSESDSAAALVGLPEPRDSYSRSPSKGYFIGTRMVEMVEEVIRGLAAEGREFVYSVVAQPMEPRQLLALLNRVNDLLSKYSTYEETASLGFYVSLPLGYTQSRVYTSGASTGRSRATSHQHSHSIHDSSSHSQGIAETETVGNAETTSYAEHESHTVGKAHTVGHSHTVGRSETEGLARTEGVAHTSGVSSTHGSSSGGFSGWSTSESETKGNTYVPEITSTTIGKTKTTPATMVTEGSSETSGMTRSETLTRGESRQYSQHWNTEVSAKPLDIGVSGSTGGSRSWTTSSSQSNTTSYSSSSTSSRSVTRPQTPALSESESTTRTQPYTTTSQSRTKTTTSSGGSSWSTFTSTTRINTTTKSNSVTRSHSTTSSESWTESETWTESENYTHGTTRSRSTTLSETQARTETRQSGETKGEAFAEASAIVDSETRARTYSVSEGGIWGMGMVPGISMSYATKRLDEAKRTVYELLSLEKQRFLEALSSGGFFVQAVILGSRETVEAAKALIISSFTPTRPSPEPLFVLDGDSELLLAAKTLSFDYRRDGRHPIRVYKIVNIYTATELAGLTHPPRVQVRGIETVAENVPEFSLPPKGRWDVEFGYALSHETLQPELRAGFDLEDLFHGIVIGGSRTGKTVLATNLVNQLVALGARALVIDVKDEWRRLLRTIEGSKAFYALYDTDGRLPELRWNPLRPPKGVSWRAWLRTVLMWFVVAYSLGPRTYQVLRVHLTKLYREAMEEGRWPTLNDLYHSIKAARRGVERRKVSFTEIDVYDKILARLKSYCLDEEEGFEGELYRMFGRESDFDIVDLVYRNVYTDLEAKVMDSTDKPFLLSLIAFAVYLHAAFTKPYPWPVVLVMEEAPQSIPDVSDKFVMRELGIRQDVWADIAQLGRRYNVYVLAITQKPTDLHKMILANVKHAWIFQLNLVKGQGQDMQDTYIAAQLLGKDPERFQNEYARFITKLPVGRCIYINKNTRDFFQAEPWLVHCDLYEPPEVTDKELNMISF